VAGEGHGPVARWLAVLVQDAVCSTTPVLLLARFFGQGPGQKSKTNQFTTRKVISFSVFFLQCYFYSYLVLRVIFTS